MGNRIKTQAGKITRQIEQLLKDNSMTGIVITYSPGEVNHANVVEAPFSALVHTKKNGMHVLGPEDGNREVFAKMMSDTLQYLNSVTSQITYNATAYVSLVESIKSNLRNDGYIVDGHKVI